MRVLYWYITTYARKHGWILVLSLVAAILIFSLIIPIFAKKVVIKDHQYIGVIGEYDLYSLPQEVTSKLSAGLTAIVPDDHTVVPFLAERWTVEDEGKTYRFVIKKDVKWQDGKTLVPEDIKYNFHDVEVIYTPNDVIFKLPDVYVPFPHVVSKPVFRSGEMRYFLFFKKPTLIGLGDYQILDYKEQNKKITEISLESKDEILVYRFYQTEKDAVIGYKKGEVDIINDLSLKHDIYDWNSVRTTQRLNTRRYLAAFFNNSLPMFSKNIRQALSYATEVPEGEQRALGPISKDSWAYLQGGKAYEKDLNRAVERILDEVPAQKMNIEIATTSLYIDEAENIKKQWEEFGQKASEQCTYDDDIEDKNLCENLKIQVNIKVSNFPDFNNYQVLLIGQEIPLDPDQYHLWHSEQSTNFTHYKNTRIDSLLEKGRKILDQDDRLATYQEFQQFLLEDPPAIFIEYLDTYDVERI